MSSPKAEAARRAVPLFQEGHAFRAALAGENPTALRNLAAAANAAEVVEELQVLLPYQAARQIISTESANLLLQQIHRIAEDFPASGSRMSVVSAFMGDVVRLHRAVQENR